MRELRGPATARATMIVAVAVSTTLLGAPSVARSTPARTHGVSSGTVKAAGDHLSGHTLRIRIVREPVDGPAHIRITGPHKFDKRVHATTTLTHLRPGKYTIHVNPVRTTYDSSFPAVKKHTVRVTGTRGAAFAVKYHRSQFGAWTVSNRCTDVAAKDCDAMLDLAGSNTSLENTVIPCSWEGVDCAEGHVTSIELPYWYDDGEGNPNDADPITDLPGSFGDLIHLKRLDLSDNSIGSLPESFGNLNHLEHLNLAGNQIAALPPNFKDLTRLTELDLSATDLPAIPKSIASFTSLRKLAVGWLGDPGAEEPAELPAWIGDLTQLESLDVSNGHLGAIPKSIGNLTALTDLNLSVNQIETIPDAIGHLKHLRVLWLAFNPVTEVPAAVGDLTALEHLWLRNDEITTITPRISRLSHLTKLDLWHNQLSGDISAWAKPLSLAAWTTDNDSHWIDLGGNAGCLSTGGDEDLTEWLDTNASWSQCS